jgi:hypothetical protein
MANLKTSLLGMSTWERLVDAARIGFHAAGADAAQASVRGQHLLNQLEAQEAMVKQAIATATRIRDLYAEIEARHGGLAGRTSSAATRTRLPRGMK